MSPVRALKPPPAVGVSPATPLRMPAGRTTVAGLASSSTESSEIAVSSCTASRSKPSIAGTEWSWISRVQVVITAIFFGVRICEVNKPWRTGIGSPSPTNEPAMVGVVARVGMLTLP